ncbi:MAG: DUF2924 domain-containing protein [Alphaproteobacteria bacterium]|nr:DUF2924 domain-containing protein [Alphaproteobacteria bacterium]
MKSATKPKPQALPRPGEDGQTDGTVLAQLAALQRLSVNELKAKWEDLFGTAAPNNARAFLELRIGYRIQELTYGGLSRDTRRMLDLLADEVEGKITRKGMAYDARNPLPGTKLVREWNGTEHTVTVRHDGYELNGRKFKSLSAVAKAITGTNWNGFRFFGFRDKQRGGT